jgi:hypothetical protein
MAYTAKLAADRHIETTFKYSRPFGIGLYTLVETVAPEETLKSKDERIRCSKT